MTDIAIAGKLIPLLLTGVVADASDIETTGGGRAQTDLNNIFQSVLHWKFNATVLDETNPGFTFVSFNNAVKDNVTVVSFNVRSNIGNAMFTELLTSLRPNDRIFFQQRNAPTTSILFRITAVAELDGTKQNFTVVRERDQGPDQFTDQADLNVLFFKGTAPVLDEVTQTGNLFNFSSEVQILPRNLSGVSLPSNAPYDAVARYLFSGASIEANDVSDRIEYSTGYSLGIDYRDNAQGEVNDDTHFVDEDIVSVIGNLASNTINYPVGTTFQKYIATRIQLNAGNIGTGAMVVLLEADGTEHEFMHITTENKIEIDTHPQSGTGSHTTVSGVNITTGALGDAVLDNNAWILLELVPSTNGLANHFDVIPAILFANGDRFEGNDIAVNLSNLDSTKLGISRSAAQRGQVTQFKAIQTPGYFRHDQLNDLWDHTDEDWVFGLARRFAASTEDLVNITRKLKGPIESTIGVPLPSVPNVGRIARINTAGDGYELVEMSRDITSTAIGGALDTVLTLPMDYENFESLTVEVLEDAGETLVNTMSTRTLAANATISSVVIGRDDGAAWNRAARTLTLSTADSWERAILSVPR